MLSNGLFVVNSTTFPALALQKNQAKLMVYKLPTNDDGGDPFMLNTTFQRDICSVQGSFESLDALATANPLYSVRSYFTYLARVQLATVGNNVTWSNKYASVSQDQNAITPTYPGMYPNVIEDLTDTDDVLRVRARRTCMEHDSTYGG